MNKLSLFLAVFALLCFGREAFDDFSSRQAAYGAYREQVTELARSRRDDFPFAEAEGYIVDVMYELESLRRMEKNEVEIVAIQAVHFQRGLPVGNWGSRQIVKTRHRVLMVRTEEGWRISELDENSWGPAFLGESVDTQ